MKKDKNPERPFREAPLAEIRDELIRNGMGEYADVASAVISGDFASAEKLMAEGVRNGTISIEEFKQLPLVLRERGSGTLEAIEHDLNHHKIRLSDLNIRLFLGSTEAIKRFVQNSQALCIISRAAITHELQAGLLTELKIDGLTFKRCFSFVQGPGPQTPLTARFIEFVQESIAEEQATA